MMGATSKRINLPQLYSHIGDDLQGWKHELSGPSDPAWSSRWSLDLVRLVSRCVTGVRGYPRRRWRPR
jgi:hypothetical protein